MCMLKQKAYAFLLLGAWLVQVKRNAVHSLYHLCRRCTLIDPRPQKISKSQRKWLKSFASSQPNDIAAMQHPDTSTSSASTDIAPTSPDLQAQACWPQHATSGLRHSTAAEPASTDGALPAVTPATELSCSATHQDSAQAQVAAAEAHALPDGAPAQASASEAEVSADAAQAQASASEAETPCEGQQSCTAHSQQPAPQDERCQLHQSVSTQASAQHRGPDLQGTLSNQVQVRHQTATAQYYLQRLLITLLDINLTSLCNMTQHLLQCKWVWFFVYLEMTTGSVCMVVQSYIKQKLISGF